MRKDVLLTQIGITIGAVTIIILHLLFPNIRFDRVTTTFAIIAIVPWLAPLLKTLKLPGGLEIELRDELRDVQATAESAAQQAEVAIAQVAAAHPRTQTTSVVEANDLRTRLTKLGRAYVSVRAGLQSGQERTSAMTRIMGEMLATASDINAFDPIPFMSSEDPGERLAAYAYTHAHPEEAFARPLAESLLKIETKPFGQYWGLRALRQIVAKGDRHRLAGELRDPLRRYEQRIKRGTDRYHELEQLLRELGLY